MRMIIMLLLSISLVLVGCGKKDDANEQVNGSVSEIEITEISTENEMVNNDMGNNGHAEELATDYSVILDTVNFGASLADFGEAKQTIDIEALKKCIGENVSFRTLESGTVCYEADNFLFYVTDDNKLSKIIIKTFDGNNNQDILNFIANYCSEVFRCDTEIEANSYIWITEIGKFTMYYGNGYFFEFDSSEMLARIEEESRIKKENASKKPEIGMTADEVLQTGWGKPEDINKTTFSWGTTEQWCYSGYRYVYFDNGIVTAIQE